MFRKDDRVYCLANGWGNVVNLKDIDIGEDHPVVVDFDNGNRIYYTLEGSESLLGNRTLFFEKPRFENWDEMVNKDYIKEGSTIYFITSSGNVSCTKYIDVYHKGLKKSNNIFKSKGEAKNSKFYKVFHGE